MQVSRTWLNDYCDLKDISDSELANLLTQLGHEVERWENFQPLPTGVLVGEILTAQRHPEATNLQLCSVSLGQKEPLTIVCGAPNARAGLRVAVATVGTTLAEGLTIKPAKIRGQDSQGMLCSEKELGLSEAHAGIMELSQAWELGQPLNSYILTEDTVFHLSLTPNRADCLSYVGLARDLAAKLGRALRLPPSEATPNPSTTLLTRDLVQISLDADVGCGRFTALALTGLSSSPSPLWLQRRLRLSGLRPINLIVDATNYVMLEVGQPLHAYDATFLQGRKLKVRSATKSEKLATLDGQTLNLEAGDLLVCAGEEPVALAGIMGGAQSEVKTTTTTIVVEAAHFNGSQIRRTAKRLALHTEASHRFERGVDIAAIAEASRRVATLLNQCSLELGLGPIGVATDLLDHYAQPHKRARIALRLPRLRSFLQLPALGIERCTKQLQALQFELIDHTDERMLFEVPSFRQDITREVDLIEEIARMEGFEKIPYELPRMHLQASFEHPFVGFQSQLKVALAQLSLSETISMPFHSLGEYQRLGLNPEHPLWPTLELANPLSSEMAWMQSSLLPGLLKAVLHNRKHGQKGSRLFECGRSYAAAKTRTPERLRSHPLFAAWAEPSLHLNPLARSEPQRAEELSLVAGICDFPFAAQSWQQPARPADFFHAKKWLEALCTGFGGTALTWERAEPQALPFLHPGASAVFALEGVYLGFAGEMHPEIALAWGFGDEIPVVFELNSEALWRALQKKRSLNPQPQRFPAVVRDLALLVDASLSFKELEAAALTQPQRRYLQNVKLFDIYQGEGVPQGKKSLAASFTFVSAEGTLTDAAVDREIQQLLQGLKSSVAAELRA